MSRLPLEDRNVWGVRGPDYEPELVCAHPLCDVTGRDNLEKHELWARSFLRHQPIQWVKLPDGRIVQNQVFLCNAFQNEHHPAITENRARIEFAYDKFWWWSGGQSDGPLDPQPRFREDEELPTVRQKDILRDVGTEEEIRVTPLHVPHEGEECGLCKRRVPKKRKPTTPTSKVHSFRGPLDEDDVTNETWIAAAKHMGVYEKGFWKHHVVMLGLASLLQGPGADGG